MGVRGTCLRDVVLALVRSTEEPVRPRRKRIARTGRNEQPWYGLIEAPGGREERAHRFVVDIYDGVADVPRVTELAVQLAQVSGIDPSDISYCLLHTIDFQHVDGIRWFLDHGADSNARHPTSQESALHWAIKRASKLELIELLLERGADPDARTLEGRTVYPEIRGWTPLDLAKRLARTDLVAVLRARGAAETPPTTADAFVFACLDGTMTAPPAELVPPDRELCAHLAQQNRSDAVMRLLALGWPLDVRGWMEATPLHWAACRGNSALARALLARGAPLVDVGGYFKTPLHTALYCRWSLDDADHVGVLEALVAAGVVLPQTLDPTGSAALDAAITRLR